METTPELERTIARIGDLPSMPELVSEVLRLSENPKTDMQQIADAISRDPGLTAKILRVSNSPYYGMRQYVGSLKLALVVLGIREVRNIVLGMSLFDALRSEKAEALLAGDFWRHSFLTGALARKLAATCRLNLQGEDFVAGLLHDIGKMVLSRQKGETYGRIHNDTGGAGPVLCEAERRAYGFTHADVAAALAIKWNLPRTLVDALWMHHPAEHLEIANAKDPKLAALIRIANYGAHLDESGDGAAGEALPESETWQWLDDVPAPVAPDERESTLLALVRELNQEQPLTFA